MKSRPIVLRDHEAQAILNGSKVQLRRLVRSKHFKQPEFDRRCANIGVRKALDEMVILPCPYGQPNDRLWVREVYTQYPIEITPEPCDFWYRADSNRHPPVDVMEGLYVWRPAIQMLKEASRITLEITSIRVERLKDISPNDAIAEGTKYMGRSPIDCVLEFARLWDELNKGLYNWISNPWVWVVEFKVLKTHN